MNSLRARITLSFFILALLVLVSGLISYAGQWFLDERIGAGVAVWEFKEMTQEIRRFEKNHLLYGEAGDLLEAERLTTQAMERLSTAPEVFADLATTAERESLSQELRRYLDLLLSYQGSEAEAKDGLEMEIRSIGHLISTQASVFAERERVSLRTSLVQSQVALLLALGGIALLGMVVGWRLSRRVVLPLRELEQRLAPIAEGRFDHLEVSSRDREILSFTRAFNRMLAELETRRRQLLHTEKLASLGVLVSGVAHELNNPLANISSSCQLALEELEQVQVQDLREWLQQIDSETERARRILLSILDFARRRPVQIGEIAPAESLERILVLMRSQLRGRAEVENAIPPELRVLADAQQLQQVFVNLIKNAQKPGGNVCHVRVSGRICGWDACRIPADALVVGNLHGCDHSRPLALLSLEDDGPGIAPEVLPRIFDPFFTTREAGQGLGMGLYIVQEIIRDLGGCIAVSSQAGRGTSFLIRLPGAGEG